MRGALSRWLPRVRSRQCLVAACMVHEAAEGRVALEQGKKVWSSIGSSQSEVAVEGGALGGGTSVEGGVAWCASARVDTDVGRVRQGDGDHRLGRGCNEATGGVAGDGRTGIVMDGRRQAEQGASHGL